MPERGAHALLAAATSQIVEQARLRGDLKYVLRAGVLEPAGSVVSCGSQWAVEDQDRMLRLCDAWLELWRQKAVD